MNVLLVLLAILAIAVVYVLLPVGGATFTAWRRPRSVRCPVDGQVVPVQVDAGGAAVGEILGRPALAVRDCTLWPERQGCGQGCLESPASG